MGHLRQRATSLLNTSMAESTKGAYETALRRFNSFRCLYSLNIVWPSPLAHIVLFISYCFEMGYAPATISLYVTGISFQHRIHDWPDLSRSFVVRKLLEGCKRLKPSKDNRAPITFNMLVCICRHLPQTCYSAYETKLFTAVYSLAYFGLFRVSELVVTKLSQQHRALMFDDISIENNNAALIIRLRISKCNQNGAPITIRLPQTRNHGLCCVKAMSDYMQVRNTASSILFCHGDSRPLTRSQFASVLSKVIPFTGIMTGKYRSHSFRIGRASELAVKGVSEESIKQMGRWSTSAYKQYIRL